MNAGKKEQEMGGKKMRIHEENTGVLSQNGSLSGMFANSKMSGAGFIPESSLGSLPTDPKTGR